MNSWDFKSSKLKCERARKHIKELDSCLTEWFGSDAIELIVNTDPDTGSKFFKFTITKPIPDDIPVIIGDIVHNLRSALDHIAIEIVRSAGHDIDGLYFPFGGSQVDIINSPTQCKIQLASVGAADIILNSVKPYKTGNRFLWSLNRLSNTDKHRLLIPVLSKVEFSWVSLEHDDEVAAKRISFSVFFRGTSARSGDIVGLKSDKLEIEDYGDPTFTLFFDERQVAGIAPNQPVVFLLHRCLDFIKNHITRFEGI